MVSTRGLARQGRPPAPTRRSVAKQHQVNHADSRRPAALGLDVGMTGTRASIAPFSLHQNSDERPCIVQGVGSSTKYRGRYDSGGMPSAANFFETDRSPRRCIGYIGDDPDQIPVKMYPYIIRIHKLLQRGNVEDLRVVRSYRDAIPQLDRFFARFNELDTDTKLRVLAHAQNIFLFHLKQVKASSEQKAEIDGVKITKLAATIPHNWDFWTHSFYILLLERVWDNLGSENIVLIYESEAIGHWLLCFDAKTRNKKPRQMVLADFGGHTLNYNVFEIVYRQGDSRDFAFFTLPIKNCENCIHGGSELHAASVKEKIRKCLLSGEISGDGTDKPFLYESLMNDYRMNNRGRIDGSEFWINGRNNAGKDATNVQVKFSGTEARALWRNCFGKPLAEFNSVLKNQAKRARAASTFSQSSESSPQTIDNVVVVLYGGTFSNTNIRNQTKKVIRDVKLQYLSWTDSVAIDGQKSSTVAVGAAMALVNAMSVKEFMSRAAFAVLVRPAKEYLPVIWNSKGPRAITLPLNSTQGADILVVCCPLAPHDGIDTVHIDSTFELQSLSKKCKGTYTISLDYMEKDERRCLPDRLILTIIMEKPSQPPSVETIEWAVYYDAGSCVCFLDIDLYMEMRPNGLKLPDLAPVYLRNKKGAVSHALWEGNRLDHGKAFWTGPDAPNLPVPTLEEFELDEPSQDNYMSEVEILDSDSEPYPPPSRPVKGKAARPRETHQRLEIEADGPFRRTRKQATRLANESSKGKQRESLAPRVNHIVRQRSLPAFPDMSVDTGFTDLHLPPLENILTHIDYQRSRYESEIIYSQESDLATDVSHRALDSDSNSQTFDRDSAQPFMGIGNAAVQERNQYSTQNIMASTPETASGLVSTSATALTVGSIHSMNTRSQTESLHDLHDYHAPMEGHLPPVDSTLNTQIGDDNLAAAIIHSSQDSVPDWPPMSQAQMSIADYRLACSTRPNSGPWAESLVRTFEKS